MKAKTIAQRPPPRRRDQAKALFHDGILDAAEVVFARRGFHAARIQDIAEEARIAIGTVYNHFDAKEDVLRALLEERTEALVAQLKPQGAEPEDYVARLELRLERMLDFVDRHRDFFVVAAECGLVTQAPTEDMQKLVGTGVKSFERFKQAFRALVKEGIDLGVLAPHDPRMLAAVLGGSIRALSFMAVQEGMKVTALAKPLVALFLHGAAVPREPRAHEREPRPRGAKPRHEAE